MPLPDNPYRWRLLALATLTNALVSAAPSMAMPVLFEAIASDLRLSLVQVGMVWGSASLPAIFTVLPGGVLGDRVGPKRMLVAVCALCGVFGALRGLAVDFWTLIGAMLLLGGFSSLITTYTLKVCGMWFPRRQLGLASGVLSMGMALGFLLGSLLSATVLASWLGGWRGVLVAYGAAALLLAVPWFYSRSTVPMPATGPTGVAPASLRQMVGAVLRIRGVWLLGIVLAGFSGCVQGALGYLPLYLRGQGWSPVSADGALAAFHTTSMLFVVPIALFSDRLRSRQTVMVAAALIMALGIGLLPWVSGAFIWVAVLGAGLVRDGFMAVFMAAVIETEGVGSVYTGTAVGVVVMFSGIGNLIAPPLGNSLAALGPGMPFVLWSMLAFLALLALLPARDGARVVIREEASPAEVNTAPD